MIPLPGILGEIAIIAGSRAAERLALRHGGQELKLSSQAGSALAKTVGVEAAAAIVAAIGPVKVTIPMAHLRGTRARRAAVAKLLADGMSNAKAAETCDVHERTARRVREAMRGHNSAPSLFDFGSDEPD